VALVVISKKSFTFAVRYLCSPRPLSDGGKTFFVNKPKMLLGGFSFVYGCKDTAISVQKLIFLVKNAGRNS
jgi:hypothetical protein